MEKITHEFKAGDWVDMKPLTDEMRMHVRSAEGVGHLKVIGSGYNHDSTIMVLAFDGILFINKNVNLDAEKELTWASLTAPIEDKPFTRDMIRDWLDGTEFTGAIDARMSELQEAVSKFDMDEIEAMDRLESKRADKYQPYTPQVGEECEVIFADDTAPEWLKTIFIGILEGRLIHKFNGKTEESESFKFKFRSLKTERDVLIEKACKASEEGKSNKLNVNIVCSAFGRAIIEDLIDAGLIK